MSEDAIENLAVGDRAIVVGFNKGAPGYRRKLLSMGLTPGVEFSITRLAPMGDPVEIRVRGFGLSLRKTEAVALRIKRMGA
ncbi:MAG: ferrous iron transport protein A [Alphaproteobacteria bacterium]|nr:ferrous iron transport protein A [Alphaproteobacteria bacterium]